MKFISLKIGVLSLATILAASTSCTSQFYYYNDKYFDRDVIWEVGLSSGGMYSLTDVGKKQLNWFLPGRLDYKSTKLNAGIYAGVLYQNLIGARLELTMGSVSATDSTGSGDRRVRNLSYRSDIREAALIVELHPLTLPNWENLPAISPYLLGGIGWFSFNPQTKYENRWVNLQPLSTAGQGFEEFPERRPYRLAVACLPFGVGFKYDLSPIFTARFEILERVAFTDYLDDASAPYIDPNLFYTNFTPEKAALADALSNRYKEKYPNRYLKDVVRGGMQTKDKYLTINLKFAMMLGREKIR